MVTCPIGGLPFWTAKPAAVHLQHRIRNLQADRALFRHVTYCLRKRPHRTYAHYEESQRSSATVDAPNTIYELLRVENTASVIEIKAAYRRLARRYHPDINKDPTAQQMFKAISQAYEILCSAELRKQYDSYGLKAFGAKRYGVLCQMFGIGIDTSAGIFRGRPSERGRDVYTVLGLALVDTVTGAEKVVNITVNGVCPGCGVGAVERRMETHSSFRTGQGAASGEAPPACLGCHGDGQTLRTVWDPYGVKSIQLGDCPACAGSGMQPHPSCTRCQGEGRLLTKRAVQVSVPAGVEEGNVLRLQGMGGAGKYGGAAGDLYVRLQVHPTANLERRGQDLHSSLDMHVYDALLGGRLAVDTPRGKKLLTVPEGTQPGDVLQLERGGVGRGSNGVISWGHHYYTVRVVMPDGSSMGSAERALLEALSGLQSFDSNSSSSGLHSDGKDGGDDDAGDDVKARIEKWW